jgi:hypothetical protein
MMHCTSKELQCMKTALALRPITFVITENNPRQTVTESFKTPAWTVGVNQMPFREYAAFFGPEELETLTAVFDATWKELSAERPDLTTEEKVALMKKKLATRILVSATAGGVRDPEKMKEQALRSLGGSFRLAEEQVLAPEAPSLV